MSVPHVIVTVFNSSLAICANSIDNTVSTDCATRGSGPNKNYHANTDENSISENKALTQSKQMPQEGPDKYVSNKIARHVIKNSVTKYVVCCMDFPGKAYH